MRFSSSALRRSAIVASTTVNGFDVVGGRFGDCADTATSARTAAITAEPIDRFLILCVPWRAEQARPLRAEQAPPLRCLCVFPQLQRCDSVAMNFIGSI